MNPLLSRWTGYAQIKEILESYPQDDGLAFINKCNHLYNVSCESIHFPKVISPSTIFLSTHHTGALDFLSIYSSLACKTPSLKIVMNNQLLKLNHLHSIAIGVNTISTGKRNTKANTQIIEHLKSGGTLLVFPAGRVGFKTDGQIQDYPWRLGIGKIAKETGSPIIPIFVQAENSNLFYIIRKYFPKLSMLFLLRALKSRKKETVKIFYGNPIVTNKLSPEEIIHHARTMAYELPKPTPRQGDSLENN